MQAGMESKQHSLGMWTRCENAFCAGPHIYCRVWAGDSLDREIQPKRRDAIPCPVWAPGNPALNTASPPDDYSMHWIGLRYASQTSSFAYIIVEHACFWDGFTPNWKYGLRAYYTDSGGTQHYQF